MSRIGADVVELSALKPVFDNQSAMIANLRSTITGRLSAVYWEGPARQRFESEWQSIQPALTSLQAGLEAAGNEANGVAQRIQAAGS